jgi:serine/threonine protein kinase
MAPEVFLGGRYGSMADLWSLGAIIYECVVGHPLHQGKSFPQLAKLYQNDTELLLT